MKRHLFGACGVLAVVALSVGNCKSDPLADLDGVPSALVIDFSYLEVPIGDTLHVTASVLDGRASPLEIPVAFRTCTGLVTVTVDPEYHPVPATSSRALVMGLTYGTSCVIAEAVGLSDTVAIATFPKSIAVTSGPDTVLSGAGATYTFEYRDRAGAPVVGVPAPTWATNDTTRGKITGAGGVFAARDTGLVDVTVTGTGTGPVSDTKSVTVRPVPFDITITPNPADPGQVVKLARAPTGPVFDANTSVRFGASVQTFVTGSLTPDSVKVAIPDLAAGGALSVAAARLGPTEITQSPGALTVNTPAALSGSVTPSSGVPGTGVVIKRTSGPAFDANTRVFFGGVRTFVSAVAADSIVVPVPGIGAVGAVELRLTRLDAGDFARRVTFTADTGAFLYADQYDDVNDDPGTAPEITANGDYYIVLSGTCANGVGGKDCDDFFQITNSGGANAVVTVNGSWLSGATAATTPDIDLYGLDPTFDFCTYDGGCPAATGANPEQFTMTVPAGETWFIYANLWTTGGATSTVIRIRVTGLP